MRRSSPCGVPAGTLTSVSIVSRGMLRVLFGLSPSLILVEVGIARTFRQHLCHQDQGLGIVSVQPERPYAPSPRSFSALLAFWYPRIAVLYKMIRSSLSGNFVAKSSEAFSRAALSLFSDAALYASNSGCVLACGGRLPSVAAGAAAPVPAQSVLPLVQSDPVLALLGLVPESVPAVPESLLVRPSGRLPVGRWSAPRP